MRPQTEETLLQIIQILDDNQVQEEYRENYLTCIRELTQDGR